MNDAPFVVRATGDNPLLAAAIHNGHGLREEVEQIMRLPEADRLREEDPFTGEWTTISGNRVVALRSRFEVDLNRPPDMAVYRTPDDAWGLEVWGTTPPDDLVARSMEDYEIFYAAVGNVLETLEDRFGSFVVYDLHSYNHRREGPDGPPADPAGNPEVNVGTGTMDRERWGGVVDAFMESLRDFDYMGRQLDVRENIKFRGGNFSRWVHETFPSTGCALAIEFKKFFMDEWTGEPDRNQVETIWRALEGTVAPVLDALRAT